jgi:hypothetical protein
VKGVHHDYVLLAVYEVARMSNGNQLLFSLHSETLFSRFLFVFGFFCDGISRRKKFPQTWHIWKHAENYIDMDVKGEKKTTRGKFMAQNSAVNTIKYLKIDYSL